MIARYSERGPLNFVRCSGTFQTLFLFLSRVRYRLGMFRDGCQDSRAVVVFSGRLVLGYSDGWGRILYGPYPRNCCLWYYILGKI